MFGDTSTSTIAENVPTIIPSTMPPVLQRFQNSVSSTHGKFAEDATANAKRDEVSDVLALGRDTDGDRQRADDDRRDARRLDLLGRRDVLRRG